MNSFEINKYLGALLGTCLILLAVHIGSGAIFSSPAPAKPGYEVAVKEEKAGGEAAKSTEAPIDTLLASASVEHGAQVAKQCGACHNFQEGQGAKVGPDLYGVVGRKIASKPGFNYSAALKAKGGDSWTFDELNKWLKDPRADVPGTAMTFAGLSNEKARADVIAYLNSLSKDPLPLPTASKEGAKESGAEKK
jgi:cytochrome c